MYYGVALYDFDPEDAEELRLRVGDVVLLLNSTHEEWWLGEHSVTREQGMFPATHVG